MHYASFLVRRILGVLVSAAAATNSWALTGDLVIHNGFEQCWSQAIGKQNFLDLERSVIDGVASCVPAQDLGFGTTACTTAACEGGAIGCKVRTHAGTFSGGFVAGSGNQHTSTGSADDITLDVNYAPANSCTVTMSSIALDYALDFTFQVDGNNGLYANSIDQATLNIHDGYQLHGSDVFCSNLVSLGGATLVSQIKTQAAQALLTSETAATVGESVCPLQ